MSFYSQIVDRLNAAAQTKDAAKVALASRSAVRSAMKFLFEEKGRTQVKLYGERLEAKFGEFLRSGNLNAEQQMFVSEVIDYIRANGEITVGILNTESPFNDYDLRDLFGNNLQTFRKIKWCINEMLPAEAM